MDQRMSITEGMAFRMPSAPDGARVRLDPGGGRELIESGAAGGAGISVDGLAKGTYWLAYAPDAGTEPVPFGVLEVRGLADEYEVGLREEPADLDRRIREGEGHLITRAETDAGETETRIALTQLRRQRRSAEARLSNYLRARSGRREGARWA